MWSVVVISNIDNRELVRYTYLLKKQAAEERRNLIEIRINQNQEDVRVILVGEK